MKKLLVIDDEEATRESLTETFYQIHDVLTAENATEGLQILSSQRVDLVILDVVMPGRDGISFLKEVREIHPDLPVVMVSAFSTDAAIEETLALGAVAFVRKPFDVHELRQLVERTIEAGEASRQRAILQKEVAREFPFLSMVGQSPAFRRVMEEARIASQSSAMILLIGEQGTGKESLARQIHAWGPHCDEPFVPVHCGSIPGAFLDLEIFGAFGQGEEKRGAFDLAGRGSVFLDEIENLSRTTQLTLAAAVRGEGFFRVGSRKSVPSAARVFATMARAPEPLVDAGLLAEELGSSFSTRISVPALRDRAEDIPLLAYHFLNQFRPMLHAAALDVESEAMRKLREYSWPGNVRELRNVVERLLMRSRKEKTVKASLLPTEFTGPSAIMEETDFEAAVSGFERDLIVTALRRSNGSVKGAAEILKITPRILQYRINKLNIRKVAE